MYGSTYMTKEAFESSWLRDVARYMAHALLMGSANVMSCFRMQTSQKDSLRQLCIPLAGNLVLIE